jgi:hypothetical protein
MWAYYISGIFIALAIKYVCYIYEGKTKFNKSIKRSTKEWFMERTITNAASWFATVLNLVSAWTFGRIYINHIFTFGFLDKLPSDISLALLLGLMMEYIAPWFAKKVVRVISKDEINF